MKKRQKDEIISTQKQTQYVFRIPGRRQEQWDQIQFGLDSLHMYFRETREKGESAIRKSDIILEALELGIAELNKKIQKKSKKKQ